MLDQFSRHAPGCVHEFISQKVFVRSFCKSQFPHKSVNLPLDDMAGDWQFIAEQPASAPHILRIVPPTLPRVGRSYERFPDGFELHLLSDMASSNKTFTPPQDPRRSLGMVLL